MEDSTFADIPEFDDVENVNDTQDGDTAERALVRSLWGWCASHDGEQITRENGGRELISDLEGFLSLALLDKGTHPAANLLPARLWLDGITEFSLERPSDTSIKAAGFSFWADGASEFYLAPFECEFYFQAVHDPECSRIIVRFGELDRNDQLVRKTNKSRAIWNRRCGENTDWAYAVELS